VFQNPGRCPEPASCSLSGCFLDFRVFRRFLDFFDFRDFLALLTCDLQTCDLSTC
jgi:hypothetical protein